MYTYIQSEPCLWTVGHYGPSGQWFPESDHDTPDQAAKRVVYLNGGYDSDPLALEAPTNNDDRAAWRAYACAVASGLLSRQDTGFSPEFRGLFAREMALFADDMLAEEKSRFDK